MNTETTVNNTTTGLVFYDSNCAMCVRLAHRLSGVLDRHGFQIRPLQTPGTATRIGVTEEELMARMHVLTSDGSRLAGADAFVEIARHLRWARPLVTATRLPGVLPLLRSTYDWIATHRGCVAGACRVRRELNLWDGLPLLLLPVLVFAVHSHLAPWIFMWSMALAVFAGCKWLTFRRAVVSGTNFTVLQAVSYLFAWVGMEPNAFASGDDSAAVVNRRAQWQAIAKVASGVVLVWGGVPLLDNSIPLAAGWVGMVGLILILHFGLFQLLALAWQRAGIPVKPLMRAPLLATSLGEFWGARWNTGFHTLAHDLAFRPLHRRLGRTGAVLAVFLISGLIHELVITIPANGGYGLPTSYFLIQGLGLVLERSSLGSKLALGTATRGRIFALVIAAAPAFWLFPPVFVRNIILPMLHALGAT